MSHHHKPPSAELPSIDADALDKVTGGASGGMDPTMLAILMMGRRQAPAPAPAPAPQPWKPKVLLNGVEQAVGTGADGALTFNSSS